MEQLDFLTIFKNAHYQGLRSYQGKLKDLPVSHKVRILSRHASLNKWLMNSYLGRSPRNQNYGYTLRVIDIPPLQTVKDEVKYAKRFIYHMRLHGIDKLEINLFTDPPAKTTDPRPVVNPEFPG